MNARKKNFFGLPRTRLGWWAVGLAILFAILFWLVLHNLAHFSSLMVLNGLTALVGLAASLLSIVAIVYRGERSWLIWVSLLYPLFIFVLCALFVLLGFILSR